jgi:flagellar protein FliJ
MLMAGYKFKLQNILKLRENVEKDKVIAFGVATQRFDNEKLKLEQLNAEMYNKCEDIEKAVLYGISVQELRLQQQFKDYYKFSISKQVVKSKMAEEHLFNCRHKLVEAVQERKIMEKLREIDYGKYLYTEQKNEEKLVDDLVSFKQSNK